MRYPLANPQIKAGFGISPWPITGYHTGTDYVAPTGTDLFPIKAGTVSWVNINHPTMGNALEINIGNGLFTRYLHCSQILVAIGQSVNESQVVARAGFTGYVEPAGDRGAHLHAELYNKVNNQPANYQDINAYISKNGGTTMENMSDDTARQVGFHYLGRNGQDGATNALATGAPDLVGRPLTNGNFGDIFLSAESREWRDVKLPKVYADRDLYKMQRDASNEQVTVLTSQLEAQAKTIEEQADQNENLNTQVEILGDKNEVLQNDLSAANDEIKQLEAQLATCGNTDITINLNIFGNIFWALIKAFGYKKDKGEK